MGRPKGSKNKSTTAVCQAIQDERQTSIKPIQRVAKATANQEKYAYVDRFKYKKISIHGGSTVECDTPAMFSIMAKRVMQINGTDITVVHRSVNDVLSVVDTE